MKLSTSKVMNIVPNSVIRKVSRQVLVAKKNSPHIFFVGGVAGTVASTVLACRATLKLSDVLTEIQDDVTTVKEMHENVGGEAYTNDEWIKDTYYVYGKASLKLLKLYSPAIIVGVVSVSALTGSHVQLVKRNQALMVAYAALQRAYTEYRERVRAQVGVENELDLYHSVQNEIVKGADGKNEMRKIVDPNKHSIYARFFDEGSRYWEKDSELNRLYVQCQQNFANNLLQARGHIFLNEVYDMLGIDRSTPGQVVGWVLNGEGDNYVSFGMFDAYNSRFVNGNERSILLDFNVDGVIYDKI
jgi:type II secretory pathway pseudopilin PulG